MGSTARSLDCRTRNRSVHKFSPAKPHSVSESDPECGPENGAGPSKMPVPPPRTGEELFKLLDTDGDMEGPGPAAAHRLRSSSDRECRAEGGWGTLSERPSLLRAALHSLVGDRTGREGLMMLVLRSPSPSSSDSMSSSTRITSAIESLSPVETARRNAAPLPNDPAPLPPSLGGLRAPRAPKASPTPNPMAVANADPELELNDDDGDKLGVD